jgi:hypothetical protein
MSLKFTIEETGNCKCNVHLYENIEEHTNEDGDIIYTYDVYVLEGIPYHENLKTNIKAKKGRWLEIAKAKEDEEPEYTEVQLLQQEITDQMLENIEQGQHITELELLILMGGTENV